VKIGNSADRFVVVKKSGGNSDVDTVGLIVGAPQWTDSLLDTLPKTLATGNDSVAIRVRFTPTDQVTVLDTLRIVYDLVVNVVKVPLSGTGGLGDVETSDTTKAFDSVLVNTTATDSLKVYNVGTALLTVQLQMASGDTTYKASPTNFAVAVGDSQNVTLTFRPRVGGDILETLRVITDAAANETLQVALSGTGVAPQIAFIPPTLDFGDVRNGSTLDLPFRVTNPGTADLIVSGSSGPFTGEYSTIGAPSIPDTIKPGTDTSLWTIRFAPTTLGTRSDSIRLTTNVPGQSIQTYFLTGQGVEPDISVAPTTVDFGKVAILIADTVAVAVENVGTSPLLIDSVRMALGTAEYTLVQTIPDGTPIIGGGQPTPIDIEFDPVIPDSTFLDTILIYSDDPDEPLIKIPVTGQSVVAAVRLSDSAVAFDTVLVGNSVEDTVWVVNEGSDTLTFTSVVTNPAQFTVTPMSAAVVAGESLAVSITFAPVSFGPDTATWRLNTNVPTKPTVDVDLSGYGASRLAVPPALNFGSVSIGQSITQDLTLRNRSTVPAEIIQIDTIVVTGDYELINAPAFPDSLAAGASDAVTLRFAPTTVGANNGEARIAFVEPTVGPDTLVVALNGTGVRYDHLARAREERHRHHYDLRPLGTGACRTGEKRILQRR